jgi:hypothetical protein
MGGDVFGTDYHFYVYYKRVIKCIFLYHFIFYVFDILCPIFVDNYSVHTVP